MPIFTGVKLSYDQLDALIFYLLVHKDLEDSYVSLPLNLYQIRSYLESIQFDKLLLDEVGPLRGAASPLAVGLQFPTIDHNYFLCGTYSMSNNLGMLRREAIRLSYWMMTFRIWSPPHMFIMD